MNTTSRIRLCFLVGLCVACVYACVIGGEIPAECKSNADCPPIQYCLAGKCTKELSEISTTQEFIQPDAAEPALRPDTPTPELAEPPTPEQGQPENIVETSPDQPAPACIDKDKDSYCENIPGDKGQIDCDDNDAQVYPGNPEICDGKDNDCNGQIDDNLGLPPLCPNQSGVCKGARHQSCNGTKGWKPCADQEYFANSTDYEEQESRCDGKDNDCNGQIDETFTEQGQPCQVSGKQGECSRGTVTKCQQGKFICTATTQPTTEICNNGKDDDCNGQADETPPCYCKAGETEECYTSPIGCNKVGTQYQCKGACTPGTRTCQTDNSWGTCQGAVTASTEICDGKDNDCDGNIDESYPERSKACTDPNQQGECAKGTYTACTAGKLLCTTTTKPIREICNNSLDDDCDGQIDEADCSIEYNGAPAIVDYAARTDGSALVVHNLSTTTFKVTCFAPDGKPKTPVVTISTTGYRIEYPSIATAPGANDISVVSWVNRATTSSSSRQLFFQLYDSDCKALNTAAIAGPNAGSGAYPYDVAIDSNGNVALAYKNGSAPTLSFYSKTGTALGADLSVDPEKKYCQGTSYGIHVAFNSSGAGVVSCQAHQSGPIAYRRFASNRTLSGTTMAVVAQSQTSNSSFYESHTIGLNDQGILAIQWQNRNTNEDQAILLNASDALIKFFVLGFNTGNGYDGFRYPGQRVELLGNDFLFRDSNTSTASTHKWYRYDATGKLIAVAAAANGVRNYLLRMGGSTVFVSDGTKLLRNPFDFGAGQGVCSGLPCLCVAQSTRPCYNGGGSARIPCQNGTQTCATDGLSWGLCTGEILPQPETCGNAIDDDCDGQIDENCPTTNAIQPIGYSDMAVANDGSIVVVHWNGKLLYGTCFGPTGNVVRSFFPISQEGRYVREPNVHIAPTSKRFVVSWFDQNSSNAAQGHFVSMLFDATCKSTSQPIPWSQTVSNNALVQDVAIDDKGDFVVAYRTSSSNSALLNFYNASGTIVKAAVQMASTQCNNTNSSIRVALHPTNGTGIFTCEGFASGPIYYQRLTTSGSFLDNSAVQVSGSASKGSYYHTHIVGINPKGDFAIQWQNRSDDTFHANLYSANGALQKQLDLGKRMNSDRDAFRYTHQRVEVFGDDFVFRDGGNSSSGNNNVDPNWYRYSPQGALVSVHLGDATLTRESLRIAGGKTYIEINGLIHINHVDLSAGVGVCNGIACLCKPTTTRTCYSGGTGTPRTPCKAGTQTCATDGMSWGPCAGEILPQPETCGNAIDDDCNGQIDDNCPRTNSIYIAGNLSDFDVADDGTIVAIQSTGTALLGHCISPGLTVQQGAFVISDYGRSVNDPRVKISKSSKLFLVLWRDAATPSGSGILTARLYNANCTPATTPFSVYNTELTHDHVDFAIDDSGNSAILWKNETATKAYLAFFDHKGVRQGTQLDVNPNGSYCRSSYGMHIAINPSNRAGIITCQQHQTSPIYYRLFGTNRTLVGTEMLQVANSVGTSSYNASHVVGMNRTGAFLIYWQNRTNSRYEASFYNASGGLVKHVIGSSVMTNAYESFRIKRENIELIGDDFIVRDGGYSNSNVTWYRYSPTGALISSVGMPNTSYKRETLRVGNQKLLIIKSNFIEAGTLILQ